MAIKIYKKGAKKKLSGHFNLSEFHCHGKNCCKTTRVSTKLVRLCEQIRNHFGKSITVNSGYRCAVHNAAVGGDKNSSHKKGQAADIFVSDGSVSALEMAQYAESIGIKRIGLYDSWIHIGSSAKKLFWKKSDYSITTFGGNPYPVPKRTIKKGSSGNDVKWVQWWLKEKGYYKGSIDGKCGVKTVAAINVFRKASGFKPVGILKAKARKELMK